MCRNKWILYIFFSGFFLFSWSANAQANQKRIAEKAMKDGGKEFVKKNYRGALRQFTRASELAPNSSGPWRWMGRCNQLLENYQEAKDAYEEYINRKPNSPDLDLIKQYLAQVEKKLVAKNKISTQDSKEANSSEIAEGEIGYLVVYTYDITGAKVRVDGKKIGKTPIRKPYELLPGEYTVQIQKKGFQTVTKEIRIQAKRQVEINETLVSIKDAPISEQTAHTFDTNEKDILDQKVGPARKNKSLAITLLSIGATGIAGGVIGGVGALNTQKEIDDFLDDNNDIVEFLDFDVLQKKGQRFNALTIIGFSIGAVGVGGGILSFLLEKEENATAQWMLIPISGGAIASLRKNF